MTDNPIEKTHEKFTHEGKTILIIEDSKPNLELLDFALSKKKYSVVTAYNGTLGLQKARETQPDLILLDINLPDSSGFDICKTLKEKPEYANVPIIFISANSDAQHLIKGFEAGGADYILKPLKLPEILARVKTHLKISHLIRLEKHYNEALKEANTEINKLLGVATHDLRNPLVSIRGLTEYLLESEVSTDQKELLDSIHDASETLLFLIENLLDYSSVEAGIVNLTCEPTDILKLIEKAVKLHAITANKKNITLVVKNIHCTQPIQADNKRISQVIDNLITNAIKFSPFKTTITIIVEQDKDKTYIKVQDQGPGIPKDEMHKLFTSFGQTSVRPTNNEQSTGLGLVICRKIVESHQGTITARNHEQGGAEFLVTLNNSFNPL